MLCALVRDICVSLLVDLLDMLLLIDTQIQCAINAEKRLHTTF